MKILFLSQRVPFPPNKGDKLRSYNQLKYLSRRHEISLLCLSDNDNDLQQADHLKTFCRSVDVVHLPRFVSQFRAIASLCSSNPLSLAYFFSSKLQRLVEQKLNYEKFDLLFIYCSSMAQYVREIEELPKVIDFVDVDSEKWNQYSRHAPFPKSILYRLEAVRLRRFERQLADSFQHGFLVSAKETADFRSLVRDVASLTPIDNGVDAGLFTPSQHSPYDPHSLVFIGAMDYFANVEAVLHFVKEILPLIRKRAPQVKLYVVGSNPAREILELARSHPNVKVTGYVEAVQPYVVNCAAMVAPMRIARGVQNKILESMAMGVPVVTSTLGLEGIAATPGRDLLVADTAELFAGEVLRVMLDEKLRGELSENGRKTILRHYDWERNMDQLEQVLIQVVKGRRTQ